MPGFLTDIVNNAMLDRIFGGVPIPFPMDVPLYFGLSLKRANKGGNVSEPSGNGYARVPVANDLQHFTTAMLGEKSNSVPILWPQPAGDWGPVACVFVADVTPPRPMNADELPPTMADGAFYIQNT